MNYITVKLTEDQLIYLTDLMSFDRAIIEKALEYKTDGELEKRLAFSYRTKATINKQLAKAKTV